MKLNYDLELNFDNDLKRYFAVELYIIKLNSAPSDFEKYAIIDEIFELHLFLQDEVYQTGRSHQLSLYLNLLEIIKKYVLLDKYLENGLFWNLYYSSYKRYFDIIDEVCNLSRFDIKFLKSLKNIEDLYCKKAFDSEIKKLLINLKRKSESIEQKMILLGEKWDARMIVSVLKDLKYLQSDLSSACLSLGMEFFQDETYSDLNETTVLKINNIIKEKIEMARCLHGLNNGQHSSKCYSEVLSLCDVIRIINPGWFYRESELALLELEKAVIDYQKVKHPPRIPKSIGFFSPKSLFANSDLSIIDDLIRFPSEYDIENIIAFRNLYGLDVKEIMRLITERQERQRVLIFNQLCGLSRK